MIFMVTGDCHGEFTRFHKLTKDEEIGMIVLGDFGANFYLNKTDKRNKKEICENYPNIHFYIVRGNHEARPQDIAGMEHRFDPEVNGMVYVEDEYPNIHYFEDYGIYDINGYSCAVIGGAYSVDKWWRLQRAGIISKVDKDYFNAKKTGWFWNEQLTTEEMRAAAALFEDKEFDFVFSHTCPYSLRPVDLFLSKVDQSSVDNSMELWMEEIKDSFKWNVWLWGHYHGDRIERPHCEMFYKSMEGLDVIKDRWDRYDIEPWDLHL